MDVAMSSVLKVTEADLVDAAHSASEVTGPYQVFRRPPFPRPARARPTVRHKIRKIFILEFLLKRTKGCASETTEYELLRCGCQMYSEEKRI